MVSSGLAAHGYQFINIADTRGTFEAFDFRQSVSDTGYVAFIGCQGGQLL